MSAKSCSAASTSVQFDQLLVEHVDPGAVVGRSVVGLVGRPLPLVVVHRAEDQVQESLLLVQPEELAHLGRPLQDQVRAVEEDRFPRHRHDEAVLGRRGRLDVVLAQADAGIGHPRPHFVRLVADAADAGNLLAVEAGGNRAHQLRDHERLLRVGVEEVRINDLPGDVGKGAHVHGVAGLQQADAAAAGVHPFHPLRAHRRLGQLPKAEILGLQMPRAQRLAEMLHGPLRTAALVHLLQFTVLDRAHDGLLLD